MRKVMLTLALVVAVSCVSFADQWEDLVNSALEGAPSRSKRKTSSGRRLLREKVERVREIDRRVPILIQHTEYAQAESLLKEALKLVVEFHGGIKHLDVAERFASLGIVYMASGDPRQASGAFTWALDIAGSILGAADYKLANLYRFRAAAYYHEGRYKEAEDDAGMLLSIAASTFGPDSPQAAEAREMLRKIYQR